MDKTLINPNIFKVPCTLPRTSQICQGHIPPLINYLEIYSIVANMTNGTIILKNELTLNCLPSLLHVQRIFSDNSITQLQLLTK